MMDGGTKSSKLPKLLNIKTKLANKHLLIHQGYLLSKLSINLKLNIKINLANKPVRVHQGCLLDQE